MKKGSDLKILVEEMKPTLNSGIYVFCTAPKVSSTLMNEAIAHFREKEGITLVLEKGIAEREKLEFDFESSWITLQVHSALDAVGLTAIVSKKLTDEKISCNILAGYFHDHIFVPKEMGAKALEALEGLTIS